MANGRWRRVGSRVVYERGDLALREDTLLRPAGDTGVYVVLVVGGTVGVLPFVDREHVLLVGQYRPVADAFSWELPGGGVRVGESSEEAAQRELREEGGVRAGRLVRLCGFHTSNAYVDEFAHVYAGFDLVDDPLPADQDESFERRTFPFDEAIQMALDDRITESLTKVALLAAGRL